MKKKKITKKWTKKLIKLIKEDIDEHEQYNEERAVDREREALKGEAISFNNFE